MAQKKTKQVVASKPIPPTVKKVSVPSIDRLAWVFRKEEIEPAKQEFYKKIFWASIGLITIVYAFISKDYGISWDENGHWRIGNANLDYFLSFGKDKTCLDETKHLFSSLIYYGESFNTLTAAVSKLLPWIGPFEVRHFLNALVGVVGIIYTGLLARILGDWKTGVFASLIIAITPAWLGHSMNNPTDIPFAATFIASLYYLVRVLQSSLKFEIKNLIFLGISIGLSLSIRVGALMLFAYVGLFLGISFLYQWERKKLKFGQLFSRYFKAALIIFAIGYFIGIIFWPYALQAPFKNPFLALSHSTDPKFFVISYELFEGKKIYMGDAPWYYVPKFIGITVPIIFLLGIPLLGGVLFKIKKQMPFWILGIAIFSFVFPLATAIYKDLMVYNAWRHYLFIYPFFVVLSALGWRSIELAISNKWIPIISNSILGIFSLQIVVWSVLNHPHQYVYFNELVGGTAGAYGNYETDYYSNSVRNAVEWLVKNEKLEKKRTLVATNNEVLTGQYYAFKISDSLLVKWQREGEGAVANWDYEIITSRTFDPLQFKNGGFPPKGTIHTIDCSGVPLAAIVKKENNNKFLCNSSITLQRYDSAIRYGEEYIKYDPNDEEIYRLLTIGYTNTQQFDKAIVSIDKAIALKPSNAVSYGLKGIIYANTERVNDAIELFKKSVQLRVNYTDGYVFMGNAYMQTKDYYTAASVYEKALTMTNPNPDLLNQTGVAYLNAGNNERALAYFTTIIREFPNYAYAYQNAAYIYMKMGNKVEANRYLQAAQQLGGQ